VDRSSDETGTYRLEVEDHETTDPHIQAIATDGGFLPDGTFVCLPQIETGRLLAAWQTKVFDLLLAAKKIDQPTVDQMRCWPHSGFSVDNSV
jgi:hypothetical protein